MRMRRHLLLAEAAHLGADRLQRLVEAGIADAGEALALAEQSDETGAVLGRIALGDQLLGRVRAGGGDSLGG